MGKEIFRYAWLLLVVCVTGCAATHDRFCSLVDSDSYVLVSLAGCETIQVSFEYESETGFSAFDTYAWMPSHAVPLDDSGEQISSQLPIWITNAVDAKLTQQGFRLDREVPDFLVSHDTVIEGQGILTLTISFADSQRIVWRGTARDEAYPTTNSEIQEERVRTAVELLLAQFPPPPGE